MPIVEDSALFTMIKQGASSRLYLLYGKESYFVAACVDKIIKKYISAEFMSFNLNRFTEAKINIEDVYDACEALPMLAATKCVAVKDLNIDKMIKADYDRLVEIVSSPNESTIFVLYDTTDSYDVKKSAKLKKLSELVQKNGIVCEFKLKDKPTLKRALCARAKKSGLEMEMSTADFLIDRCSYSYSVLTNETDKLIAYVTQRGLDEITKEHVSECCIPSIDSTAFDLARAILHKKAETAFLLIDELFFQRVEALAILGALNLCFADLYRAKTAINNGKTMEQVLSDFNYPKNRVFAVKNAFRDVSGFSIEALRRCISALLLADYKIKSSKADHRLLLEQMLITAIAP